MEVFMKAVYPIVMKKGKKHIVVHVPDFNINTQGKNEADAMEMARDAIGLMGIDMEDDGLMLPEPSELAEAQKTNMAGVVTLVDVDFAEYRRKHDMRSVRKNCTIPSWLNYEAENAGINFSALLQTAIKEELHIRR
jgi:predicted RNase H-like HicB family nuclease